MKAISASPLLRWSWLAAALLFVSIWLYPVSSTSTRSAGIASLAVFWLTLIFLFLRHRVLLAGLLALTVFGAVFLAWPVRRQTDAAGLREDYAAGLRRYEGVSYVWGGESPLGIDCSGLVRRGLVDALFFRGLRTLDGALVREAIWIWWHDCSAGDFGAGRGFTASLFSTASINALDHSKILPGDLAVTPSGLHVMAFLGGNLWIEADPNIKRVVVVPAPSKTNNWFHGPMKIVRWKLLGG